MTGTGARTRPGRPYPLGATWDGAGANFALYSEHATAVELCLFDAADPGYEVQRIAIPERTDQVWHVYLPGVRPGLLYGFRVHGPWAPSDGHRFNAAKVLLDPYARAIDGSIAWTDAVFDYRVGEPGGDLALDERDNARHVPKSVLVDPAFTWGDDRPPRTPWHRTVIYELHVKGFTIQHPRIPAGRRGTYSGLAEPAAVDYLAQLGITAVELLPVHHSITEKAVWERGLANYWGYNSIGFFAPDARFSSTGARGEQVAEFKTMVKVLHQAGIEVILDVVYNHTAESDHLGPTLCFRGIDNAAYYRLLPFDRRQYLDYTGCGNTVDMTHPRALQLMMDSLRYWVVDMHVDGFRFDLAAALARELHAVDRLSGFFDVIQQDPVLAGVKLIAEPWDLGEGGYQVGNFPAGWVEWNDKYRDSVRRYWHGHDGQLPELGYRLTGSSDLYEAAGRRPSASVNYVTAHDGFTLADLVSYERKHNEANGEGNRDGTDQNLSANGGVEGPTDEPLVLSVRERQMRNFLATLLLSQGVPMLCAGDEVARSQRGNNNAYCQDNPTAWLSWAMSPSAARQLEFTRRLIRFRLEHPVFQRRHFFRGRPFPGSPIKDLAWLRPDGIEMTEEDWADGLNRCLGLRLAGDALEEVDDMGCPIIGDTFLVLMNASSDSVSFVLPAAPPAGWQLALDTRGWDADAPDVAWIGDDAYRLEAHSLAVLRLRSEPVNAPRRP